MAQEKHYTAKQVATALLDRVGEILKKSELHKKYADMNKAEGEKGIHLPAVGGAPVHDKHFAAHGISDAGSQARSGKKATDRGVKNSANIAGAKEAHKQVLGEMKAMPKPNLPKSEDMGKGEQPHSDGHYSMNADPGEPKAGKASKPGKCPECGHPSEATGQGDTLPRSKAQENWMEKAEYASSNSKKLGYKTSEAGNETRQPEKSDNAFKVEGEHAEKSSNDPRLAQQKDPQHNAAEQKEGNNELAGTTPTQVGQDGKNKPGYDEMKGHLKLAKFIGMKHYKRGKALEGSQSQSGAEAQHAESIKNK